jgi:hypothetical protein
MECLVHHNMELGFVSQGLSCVMDELGGATGVNALVVRVRLSRIIALHHWLATPCHIH